MLEYVHKKKNRKGINYKNYINTYLLVSIVKNIFK